jgi:RHS repeat-associated protein
MKRLLAAATVCLAMGSRPAFASEFDVESGLVHMGAREYDPSDGRFLQEDPMFHPGQASYEYALNNPIAFTDPTGTSPTGAQVDWAGLPGCDCPNPPQFPPGQNIYNNVCESSQHTNPLWFKGQLYQSGAWDYYHNNGIQYDAAGNFMYGAAAAAAGAPQQVTLRWAGFYKEYLNPNNTYDPSFGSPFGSYPYGNAPDKQATIASGWQYGACQCQNQ